MVTVNVEIIFIYSIFIRAGWMVPYGIMAIGDDGYFVIDSFSEIESGFNGAKINLFSGGQTPLIYF